MILCDLIHTPLHARTLTQLHPLIYCREKMRASKALGRHHDSDADEVSDPELASEDEEGGGQGEQDPFFQHDADVFNDPFFTAVRASLPSPDPKL